MQILIILGDKFQYQKKIYIYKNLFKKTNLIKLTILNNVHRFKILH